MKQLLTALIIVLVVAPAQARDLTIQEQAGKIKLGGKVEVTLASREVLKGRRGAFSGSGFSLEPMKDGVGTARAIEFTDVQRIRRTGLNTAEKVAIISVAAIGAVALGVYIWIKATGC